MKKIFNFKKKKGSPSASETASVLSSNYDIKEKDLGKVHKAAFNGDLAKLRQLAKKNDLNQLDKENRTPLHIACSCGHTEVVQFLLENKVKLNLCDNQNRSALMKAVQSEQERCVSLLLEHEADPDLLDLKGDTALHHCARMPSISTALLLLEHSANINAQNKDGNTPLMLAVLENHVDMAELLLKEGADVNVKNQEERSALMIAACCGHISMVRLLLQYNADITIIDVKGWSSDDYAVMNGHHACSHLILEHGAKNKSHKSPSNSTTKRRRQTNLGSPSGIAAALAFGGPAVDKEATEDNSITDSISRASKSGAADSWPSSDDDDDMDLSPKEKKINLKKLISTSKREKVEVKVDRNADKSWSESESDPEIDESDGVKHPLQSKAPLQPLLETPPTLLAHPPQMTSTPFNHTVKEEVLNNDDEEEEEEDNGEQEKCSSQKENQRDFLSELGLEKEEEYDSPWDSESCSESLVKKTATPAKAHKSMSSICEESTEVVRNDDEEKEVDKEFKSLKRENVSVLSQLMDSKEAQKKTDLMEELGLGDADDLEDASDWDSASTTSKASKNLPVHNLVEEPISESLEASTLPETQQQQEADTEEHKETSPERNTAPLPSPRSLKPNLKPQPLPRVHSDSNNKPENEESDWDTDSSCSAEPKPSPPNATKAETAYRQEPVDEDVKSEISFDEREPADEADDMRGNLKPGAFWDTGRGGDQAELDQGKRTKVDTSSENPKPKFDGIGVSRTLEREGSVSPKLLKGDAKSSPSSKKKKEQSPEELEMPDEFEDLTQSSDTATEELETPLSGYRNASLLFKQLDSSYLDSVSVVKLQNMFHEYERTIQRERDRHARLAEKNSQLEQERNELKNLLEEIRGSKSNLEHLRLELETDMNNIKFLLRQEQEKHQSSIMLYNKTREQLQRKEEQQRDEAEERHKAELIVRSLELEIRALKNTVKQLEEDRDESQRLLAHERSARVLQEDLLNNHLRKQQDIQEENMRNLNRSNEAMSQLTEASDRERELMLQNRTLLDELSAARAELERSHSHSQQEESRLVDERDALRERLEDARRDLKLSEDALAQTVFQYNGQLSTLKAESSVCTSRLEHERQLRQQTEAEAETGRARLQAAIQEAERCQASRAEVERSLQREREEHQRVQEKHLFESSAQRDTLQSLSQQLSKVEARANNLENECHRNALTLAEKNLLLETLARDKEQALSKLKDLEGAVQSEREQSCRAQVKQESMQERLVQAQSEAALLRQQLEEALNKGSAKDRAVTDVQQNFSEMLNQLRADGEDRVQMVEERSRELAKSNGELREQNYKLEQEKADREAAVRQLQQELADSLKKLSMCEASLEVNTRYRNDLEEEKTRNLKDMDRLKAKLQEGEESLVQAERRIAQMKSSLEDRERDACSTTQKLQEAISESATREQSVRQLEEAVQRLEIENARLEAVVKQQENRIEVLQRGAQEGAVMRNRLEDLVTNLQSNKMTLEEQLNREVQKQSMLSHNAQDSQALWEEELKSRSRLGLRLSELEKEKGELTNQMELEKKKAKKLSEQKKCVDGRLEQEMQRNSDLQKEMYRMKTLLKSAKKQLRSQPAGHPESPVLQSLRGDTENTVIRMKMRVEELQSQLERESSRSSALEQSNRELKQKVSALKSRIVKPLEASGGGVMDQSQAEQYRKETEERARQEIRQKLEEVNLFLQTQAASQEALDQLKAASEASQRSQMEQRIRTLEDELSRSRTQHQDALVQRETNVTELQRFKQLYGEELRLRKSLADKLHRSSERLAEANAKLLSERQRSKSLLCSGVVNASCLDGSSLGHLNRSLSITTPLMGTLGDAQSHRVEAYLAKMQTELERNISKELDYGELGGGSARLSPVGSASSSQTHPLTLGQEPPDPLSRATQQYLEVLKKNYRI